MFATGYRGFRKSVMGKVNVPFPFPIPVIRLWGEDAILGKAPPQEVGRWSTEEEMRREETGLGTTYMRKKEGAGYWVGRSQWTGGRGVKAWWVTGVRVNYDLPKEIRLNRSATTMVFYGQLQPDAPRGSDPFHRVWRRVRYTEARRMYLLAPETFALIEFVRQELELDRCLPVILPRVSVPLQLEAKFAIEEGWRPAWWADWRVEDVYRSVGESFQFANFSEMEENAAR